ncbi:transforming growth factor beta regulator 1 [Anopheles maculipalpis]|uniref:transforming growth factor beta regulator 1 n=1 Tax=Anopheles maculipalpis TaxID=1496333 RepID=UPI002158C1AF|nr:transforming growth factor beta regulator 1 [Anopheles maculipalpis]
MQRTSCESSEAATAAVEEEANAKFRQKYRRLKRYMTDMVFENAALSDHIAQVQEKVGQVSEERRFLLKKLLDHEHETETQLGRTSSKLNELIANSLPPKRQYKKREKNATVNGAPNASTSGEGGPADGQQEPQETVLDGTDVKVEKDDEANGKSGANERHGGKNGHRMGKKRGPAGKGEPPSEGGKGRRKGRPSGGTGKKRMQNITVDQSGHPKYPFTVGGFSVQSLGDIVPDRAAFHTECTIYPIGYTITRPYGHYKDPEKRCIYTCRVVDDGERPRFEIVPESTDPSGTGGGETGESKDMDLVEADIISGPTTDDCHAELLQRINTALNVGSIDSRPMGDWFFGLAHPTVANLLQRFPSAKGCTNYRTEERKETEANMEKENDPALSYDALMRHITISTYRTVPEIKEEPPDELFDHSDGNSFSLSV